MKKPLIVSLLFLVLGVTSLVSLKRYEKHMYRPYLTVMGFIDMADGLGRQTVEIIDALKNDVSIRYKNIRGIHLTQDVPKEVLKIANKPSFRLGKVVIYEDVIHRNSHTFFQKYLVKEGPETIRIAYSMFESSAIPEYFVYNLNIYFDAVVVPDIFLVECYKNSGVKIPIFVLPLGLNLQPFLKASIKQKAHTPFVFANFSAYNLRKNHKMLIESFYEAFKNNPDVQLWINGRSSADGVFEDLQELVKSLGVSNIRLTNARFNNIDYLNNFHKIDCYVSLSQGEGFSIQPREAMALGIPVILSSNTAQTTICHSGLVTSIVSSILVPAYYEHLKEVYGFRYDLNKQEAVAALKEMKTFYKNHLKSSLLMRSWASQYDYTNLQPLYRSLIKPKKIILGDTDIISTDYLMTTSKLLYEKYQKLL